jgi:hypothetical protein
MAFLAVHTPMNGHLLAPVVQGFLFIPQERESETTERDIMILGRAIQHLRASGADHSILHVLQHFPGLLRVQSVDEASARADVDSISKIFHRAIKCGRE